MDKQTRERTGVRYRDRHTQEIVREINQSESTLRWLYEHPIGRLIFKLFLNNPVFCWIYGAYHRLPHTRCKIEQFVALHQIRTEEIEFPLDNFPNFNAFFSRRLKPGARSFDRDETSLCSPADGKLLVLPNLTPTSLIPVKGTCLNLATLLCSNRKAQQFIDGAAAIFRLSPSDYHRFHFFDDGHAYPAQLIHGQYHSVHPVALARIPQIFHVNKRALTEIHTRNFDCVSYIEIGAIVVASIQQTYEPGNVRRGQEKGYFQYGGSTIILLFASDRVVFDSDILKDSERGLEVRVSAGEKIGMKRARSRDRHI